MSTPFSYSGQYNPYDPFNQRVRGQGGGGQYPTAPAQPVPSAAYPQQPAQPQTGATAGWPTAPAAPSTPTGAYPGMTPSSPVYQGPPAQGGQSSYPAPQTNGWPQAPQPQQQQQVPAPQYPNTGTVPPAGIPPMPQQPPAPAAHPYAMPGWDQGKWADPTKHDAKYDAGHLMSTLAPSVANIPTVLGMLQQQGHNIQYQGGDTAIIDGYQVDLVQGSNSDHPAWQWYVPQSAPSPEQGQMPGGVDPYTAMFMQMMQQQQQPQMQGPPAQAAAGGVDQNALLQSILQLLQNQAQAPRGPAAPNFNIY